MVSNKIKQYTKKAKQLGKSVNNIMQGKNGKYLAMVPYVPQVIGAANAAVQLGDDIAELMQGFGFGEGVSHPGAPFGQVAGVANNITVKRSSPKFRNTKGIVRIVHKELVSLVNNSTTLALSPNFVGSGSSIYQVNAASGMSFPWLSTIAQNFDEYKFNRVRLVYVPLCSTTETGRVMLGYDVDSTDALVADRQALSSYSCSSEGSAWAVQTLDCKLSDTNKWYYTNLVGDNSPSSAYLDQGQFFSAAWGGGSSNGIGEIYVLYDVSLKTPQPSQGALYQAYGNADSVVSNFPTNSPPTLTSTTTSVVVTFPVAGDFLVVLKSAATAISGSCTFAGGAINLNTYNITDATHSTGFVLVRCNGGTSASVSFTGLTALAKYEVYVTKAPRLPVYTYA